jgi:hypothetical protein
MEVKLQTAARQAHRSRQAILDLIRDDKLPARWTSRGWMIDPVTLTAVIRKLDS